MHRSLAEPDVPLGAFTAGRSASLARANTPEAWFTCGRLVAFLFLYLIAAYPEVILGSHTFFHRDFGVYGYPVAHHFRECFWRGELPLWNPLSDSGQPFAAQWANLVFYPGSLLFLLGPLRWALGFFCLGHLLLAGASMYCLAHRWTGNRIAASFAGLAFATNGLFVHSLMWPHYVAAFAWMPLVILWVERACVEGRKSLLAAVAIGTLQMLAGAPEIILLTWLFASVWLLVVTRGAGRSVWLVMRRFVSIAAFVAGLAAIQLLPFLDLLAHSQRHTGYGSDVWSMPLWGVANFLVPLFHMTPSITGVFTQDSQQLFSSYYVGIGTVLLALFAMCGTNDRRKWLLAVLCGAALVLALGERGYAYAALKKLAPVFGFMRYPVKWLLLVPFLAPLLAAFGLAEWLRRRDANEHQQRRAQWQLIIAAGGLVIAIVALIWAARRFPVGNENPSVTQASGLLRILLLAGTVAGLVFVNHARSAVTRVFFATTIVVLTAVDLLTHVPRQNPVVITQAFEKMESPMPDPPRAGQSRAMIRKELRNFLGYAKTRDELTYFLTLRRSLFSNCNLIEGLPKVDGFWALDLREYSAVRDLLYAGTNAFPAPLADFLGVTHISSLTTLGEWERRKTALPLVTAGQSPVFASESETLNALASETFRPREVVYLRPEDKSNVSISEGSAPRISEINFSAHRMEFDANAATPSLVVIAQAFYHPWKALVDGKEQRLLRANHAFQALQVPAGAHRVTLAYVDWMFRLGAMISLACVLLWCAMFWRMRRVSERT